MNPLEIKGARVRLGYKQRDVADYLKISTNSYRKKESGIVRFTDDEKVKIARLFDWDGPMVNRIFFNGELPL